MPVKLAIVGTSNSVLRIGYVSGLARTDGIDIIANMSIGSSHSILAPMAIRDEVLDEADFVIFDFTVNEQRALNRQMYNLDTMREMFFYLLAKCQRHSVVPVFLFMPMRLHEDGYTVMAEYMALCERYGVFYVDPSPLVRSEAARLEKTWHDVFSDFHHLIPEVAENVGCYLGEALKTIDLSKGPTNRVSSPDFTFAPAPPFADGLSVIDRATALIRCSLVRMVPGESMTVSVDGDASVVGIALNMSRTNANLRLEGRTRMIKRLAHPNYDVKAGLRAVVWQLMTPLQTADGGVLLTCEADRNDDSIESNDHYARHIHHARPELEIAGLILRSATRSTELDWPAFNRPNMTLI